MKKTTLIIGIIIAIIIAICVCRRDSFSVEENTPTSCSQSWEVIIKSQQDDWYKNLKLLTEQEKPASEMVDEAFESMRTYKCWTEYTCKAVAYSTVYGPEATAKTGITSNHLDAMQYFGGAVPTCADPEDLGLEINYIPLCELENPSNSELAIALSDRYKSCKEYSANEELLAMTKLQVVIKDAGANQNADAVSNKMSSILNKMPAMEMNMEYVGKGLRQVDTELNCYIKDCT